MLKVRCRTRQGLSPVASVVSGGLGAVPYNNRRLLVEPEVGPFLVLITPPHVLTHRGGFQTVVQFHSWDYEMKY